MQQEKFEVIDVTFVIKGKTILANKPLLTSSSENSDIRYSEQFIYKMQQERFKTFELQDPANEHFDVTFKIDGKKLYANKFILTSISETMASMLSDRWTNKDEVVTIKTYSYDNFYEFLRFLYTGGCNLTNGNVFKLVDMAESYGVGLFKEYCDNFLSSRMKYDIESIEEMFEFADMYSLKKIKNAIKDFIGRNFDKVTGAERFLSSKKSFVDFLSSIDISSRYYSWNFSKEEEVFRAVYKWTEHQVKKQRDADDKNFDLLEAVKDESRETFPHIYSMDKTKMSKDFLTNFLFKKGILLSSDEFKSIYGGIRSSDREFCFEYVSDLAEKQALQKQKMNPDDENFNLVDSIKADLAKVIPLFNFGLMKRSFVTKFVVPKGILTEEEADRFYFTRISVKNFFKTITGDFKDDIGIGRSIQLRSPYNIKRSSDKIIRFLDLKFHMPKTPSIVKKTDGVEWYLSLDEDKVLSFKHHTMVNPSDYLLAEMKSKTRFCLISNETTTIQASFNHLNDIIE